MYVILRDGTVIENAVIAAAGPSKQGMGFAIHAIGEDRTRWYDESDIQTIRFDRDTVNDPPPPMGPDDFKIGTRHDDDPPLTFTRV